MEIFIKQVDMGTHVLMATRYPSGTSFVINRVFTWFPKLSAQLSRVYSILDLQKSDGQAYFFAGTWLYLKIVDPGDSASRVLEWQGMKISHARWYDLKYEASSFELCLCRKDVWPPSVVVLLSRGDTDDSWLCRA